MRRIFYLMSGPAHLPYLVASLRTLRDRWDGPVTVFAWPESWDIVQRIAKDHRLAIHVERREPEYRGKNDQFIDKIRIAMSLPKEDVALYLDADTTFHGPLDRLFVEAEQWGFCATQFCDWMSNWSIPRGRIRTLSEFQGIPKDLIERTAAEPWPSVNGGVWACRPDSPVLPRWHEWTLLASPVKAEGEEGPEPTFIADEKVLHILQIAFPMKVLTGGGWNCSPVERYQPKDLRDEDVTVWHYHGDANVRPDKSRKACDMWWRVFEDCLRQNLGGVAGWWRGVGNRWIDRLLRKRPELGKIK